jgi:hypothetical protein
VTLESGTETGFHLSRLHLGCILFSDFGLRRRGLIILRDGRLDERWAERRSKSTDSKNGQNAVAHLTLSFDVENAYPEVVPRCRQSDMLGASIFQDKPNSGHSQVTQ